MRRKPAEKPAGLDWNLAERVASALGVEAIAELGFGMQGVAYALDDGDVLKLTREYNEAAVAAAVLSGDLADHGVLPAIRAVASFDVGDRKAYAVVRESAHGLGDGCDDSDADVVALKNAWSKTCYGLWWRQPLTMREGAAGMRGQFANADAFVEGLWRMQVDNVAHPSDLGFDNIGEAAGGRLVVRDFGRFEVNRWDVVRPRLEAVDHLSLDACPRP